MTRPLLVDLEHHGTTHVGVTLHGAGGELAPRAGLDPDRVMRLWASRRRGCPLRYYVAGVPVDAEHGAVRIVAVRAQFVEGAAAARGDQLGLAGVA